MLLYAPRNMLRNRLRFTLSLIGVAAGFSILVSSLSIVQNFRSQIGSIIHTAQIDVMVQSRQAPTPITSRISREDYLALQKIPHIRGVSAMILGSLRTPFAPYFLLVGLSPDETLAGQVRLLEGRWFEPGKRELALGQLAAQELGYRVGNRIALSPDLIFTITGIYSFGYKMTDSSASMDIQDAQSLLNWDDSVNMAFIHVGDPVHTRQIIDKINQEYPHLYASAGGDVVDQIRLFDSFDLFAWIISAASMLTCCLIVTNTLVMAVSERTREFGILMAIGWNRWMIYRTIFYEGLLLSFLGCITGTVLAVVSLHLLQVSRRAGIGLIEATLPLDTIVGVHLIALILAAAASLYPATITLRLSPAQALRHE